MIPSNISQSQILKALRKIDKLELKNNSRIYDLLFKNKNYAPKEVIRKANEFINGTQKMHFGGGEEQANKFLRKRGFTVVEKGKEPIDYFFDRSEIEYLINLTDEIYDRYNPKHKVLLELLRHSLRPKVNFWAKEVTPNGFIFNLKTSPLKRGYGEMTIRRYVWASIFRNKDIRKNIYFTVGVHAAKNDPDYPAGLVYKLDCQSDQNTNLTADQIERFRELAANEKVAWEEIKLEEIENYTWDKLIKESRSFIEKNQKIYDSIVQDIWGKKKYTIAESKNRICRICWNTNGWVKPSGRIGKAPTDSHEKRHGFGHEEWLFDTSRVIDGYQYGFLEPIRKFQTKYQNKKFNLLLYTRDAVSEQKFWVGQLNNVEVISEKVAAEVIKKFNKTGLLEIMKSQLDEVGLDGRKLENEYLKEMDIINIRFRKEEIQNIFEKLVPIDSNEKRITSLYYVLLPWDGISSIKQIEDEDYFKTGNSGNGKLKSTAQASYKSSTKEIELTHNLISDSFLEYLKKEHGVNNVKRECRVTGNNRVDIVVRKHNKDIFYEIKTYPHLITSLRYALGQLIEYSCYPDKKRASQYYLVSNIEADQKFEDYITHLNKFFGFNLGYICFDIESESVIQKI